MFGPGLLNLEGLALIFAALFGLFVVLLFARRATRLYHRVPPNQVMVIYGKGKMVFGDSSPPNRVGVRLVTGGGALVWPIMEAFDFLDLTVMTISKAKDEVYTVDGVPIKLDWVAQVQIDSEEGSLLTAARAFLGRPRDEVKGVIAQTLSANFRAIVGQLTVEDVHRDRDAFVNRVQELASDDMAAMGVCVISMGIEEITDDQGYFEAMAKPVIAVVKRDAVIAEAEADREARIRAAEARQEAEQAELAATREIVEQQEALELREVGRNKTVGLAQAEADEAVQDKRASAVEKRQEAEVLVPARAQREAIHIEADAERRKLTIAAEARAEALREEAGAEAEATEVTGRAEAKKLKALKLAEAEGTQANLLAEAEGKHKLAVATAAEDEIHLRQIIAEMLIQAEVAKVEAMGEALRGVGENVRIVQFSGENGGSAGNGSALVQLLQSLPEVATVVNAKTEALSGESLEGILMRVRGLLAGMDTAPVEAAPGDNGETKSVENASAEDGGAAAALAEEAASEAAEG